MIIVDDFLSDFEGFRQHCDSVDFKGHTNPVDGVFYPGVSVDIPESVRAEIIERVGQQIGRPITPRMMFMRLSPEGIEAPHQAHTDTVMSNTGMMLYLNRVEDCIGGTSFVMHKKTGLKENPINEAQEKVWREDTNNPDAWQILDIASMKPNRAMLFDTNRMHRAEPIGGFGKGAEDGRLVLTFFFDI